MAEEKNYFEILNSIDVSGKTEKKNGLTYLSWAWAWGELKKRHPDATYTIYQNEQLGGMPYFTDGKTCFVKTGVTVNGIENIDFLPVMDYKNKSIPTNAVTTFDVNKAIQRSIVRGIAKHGLGLFIYAGEDLPEDSTDAAIRISFENNEDYIKCPKCGKKIEDVVGKDGKTITAMELFTKYGMCSDCVKKERAKK